MNTAETEQRETETFVIAKTDEGFRVCSPLTPGKQFVVTGLPDNPQCTCPEFVKNEGDPVWHCKHIQAVLKENDGASEPHVTPATALAGKRSGDEPPTATARKAPGGRNNGNSALMLLKRSVSPDGRIDSLSVEFSFPIGKTTPEELKTRAGQILALQADIASGFLKANGEHKPRNNGELNAAPGQLLAVASMNSKWGKRLFLNILVNGKVLKLFGTEQELSQAVTTAGYPAVAEQLADGYTLNLPCRVITKPSPDGKYTNVERVLPAQAAASK